MINTIISRMLKHEDITVILEFIDLNEVEEDVQYDEFDAKRIGGVVRFNTLKSWCGSEIGTTNLDFLKKVCPYFMYGRVVIRHDSLSYQKIKTNIRRLMNKFASKINHGNTKLVVIEFDESTSCIGKIYSYKLIYYDGEVIEAEDYSGDDIEIYL